MQNTHTRFWDLELGLQAEMRPTVNCMDRVAILQSQFPRQTAIPDPETTASA